MDIKEVAINVSNARKGIGFTPLEERDLLKDILLDSHISITSSYFINKRSTTTTTNSHNLPQSLLVLD